MPIITILDYILLPIYLLLIYKLALSIRNKYYPEGHILRKYFIPGLTVKIIGAIAIGLIYAYYYKGGDTFGYFEHIKLVNASFNNGLNTWWHIFTNSERSDNIYETGVAATKYYIQQDTSTVWQIGSIIGILCFNTYLPLSVLLAFISYSGVWLIFRYFTELYPKFVKWLAISCLFIPSVAIWGSGLFKDTFCQMALGWVLWGVYKILRTGRLKYLILIILGIVILIKIKIYIFIIFAPLLFLSEIIKKIGSYKLKSRVFIYTLLFLLVWLSRNKFQKLIEIEVQKYSIETIAQTAVDSKAYFIKLAEEDQSSVFDLGEIEPTIYGLFKKFLPAANASLYRPYLWEVKKLFVLIAAIEAFAFQLLSLYAVYLIIKNRKIRSIFNINILFWLSFSIFFAFITGITTSNFGSLSRYRLPFLPFFASSLIILILQNRSPLYLLRKAHSVLKNN